MEELRGFLAADAVLRLRAGTPPEKGCATMRVFILFEAEDQHDATESIIGIFSGLVGAQGAASAQWPHRQLEWEERTIVDPVRWVCTSDLRDHGHRRWVMRIERHDVR